MDFINADTLYLCIDQGGHATRSIIFNHEGEQVASAFSEIETLHPAENFVEYDAKEILSSVFNSIEKVIEKIPDKKHLIISAGLATQRSNVVCWNKNTGEALSPIISWQDRRNSKWLASLHAKNETIHHATGLFLSPHYGASKLRWCIDNIPAVKQALENNTLAMGPMSSFISYHLLIEKPFVVDPANASRTQLWNAKTLQWDESLLSLFDIPLSTLPECVHSSHSFGHMEIDSLSIPLELVTGDQSAAMYTYGELQPSTIYINTGTGAFISRPSGPIALYGRRLLTSIIYCDNDLPQYVLEGTVNGAGSALEWLAQKNSLSDIYNQLPGWLEDVESPPLFLNGVSGLAAPFWAPDFPSQFDTESGIKEQAVAIIESIVFLLQSSLDEMLKLSSPPEQIQITGGLSSLNGLNQRIADLSGLPVYRPTECEATARGTAFLLAGQPHHWPEQDDGEWYEPEHNEELKKRFEHWFEKVLNILRAA